MKRYFLLFCLMVSALFAVSQIKVTFTGVSLEGSYCPFERVNVTNVTRGWNETLVYPDTVLILSGLGVDEFSSSLDGITRVYPNPFEDFTNVEFCITESGPVNIRVIGIDGVLKASWEGYMQLGIHQVRITLDKPQMAFVVLTTEKERYVGKLLHVGEDGINEIDVCSAPLVVTGCSNSSSRSGESGDFRPGDMMSYEGVLVNCGNTVYSDMVTHEQFVDETIPLVFPEIVPGGAVQYLPYCQTFDSGFGTYTTSDVMGPQTWEIAYNTAKMTGFVNSTNNANEDWLISSPVAIKGVTDAKMTISYIARYFNNIDNEVTIWASTNYDCNYDLMDATWTQLPTILTQANNWNDFQTDEISLTQYVGQIVTFALRYTSSNSDAGTIEIQSICIEEGTAGGGPTPPGPGGEVQTLPYYQSFATEFGTYMTYDELGAQSWEIDYNTAKMTGYVGGSYYANIDWLISSPVAITGVSDAKMTMSYIGRYFNNINDEVTIWASTDYDWSGNPANATWRQVTATLSEGNNWTDFVTTEIALTDYVGQTVTFAVKYTSTDSKAGTMEIQSITIEEGGGVGPNPPTPGGELQYMPYSQSFATEFGTYTTYDVSGPQFWMIDYNTAKMTGYANNTNYANQDWLISSPVAITGVSDAKMTMVYIARYFNNISSDVTIWASTNYIWGSNPTTASWTEVPCTLTQGNNWTDFVTTDISLTQCVGQTVTLAVRYVSDEVKAGTIEIQSITIQEGSGEEPPTPPGPGAGSGTASDPYNVASGIALQGQNVTAWVQGYIVGAVRNGLSTVTSNDDVIWSIPVDSYTNVVIADDVTCREIANCIIVNLPSGKPLRAQVNLYDNPDNYGKRLAVLGTLRTYFGQAGLRDSNGTEADFVLEGGETPPPGPGTEIFSETFASGQGQFTIQDVVMPSELTYIWQHAPSYSCMKASSYVGQAYAAESWLVSPTIDLSSVSVATLKFEQAVNYASPQGALKMMISTNYNGDVTTAAWNELNIDQWPAGNNWTFINSTANLADYVGHAVTIAFKYTSTTSSSATWEVKNFVVE